MDLEIKHLMDLVPEQIIRYFSQIPFSWRVPRIYGKTRKLLGKSQWFSKKDLETYQFTKIKNFLIYAYNKTLYYKELFDHISFDPLAFSSISELGKIPLLSKTDVFNNFKRLKSSGFNSLNSYVGHTGGTTGHPLKVLFSVRSHFIEWGYIHEQWQRVAFSPNCRRVACLGVPFKKNKTITWKYNHFHKELQISPLHMENEHIAEYVKLIKKFKPKFIYGLPSALTTLAEFIEKKHLRMDDIRAVLCGSENISEKQKSIISRAFHARVYSWYGQTEKVVLGGECEFSSDYHIFPEYGYTELVDERTNLINKPGKIGEIIGTGFINIAMPLIRYRTGDYGEYADGDCACGRKYPRIKNIIGRRNSDYLYDKDKARILLSAINTQKGVYGNISQWQFFQETPGKVYVNVLANQVVTLQDIKEIQNDLNLQCEGKIRFYVSAVDNLIKTELGKTKTIIQNIKND